MAKLTLAKKGRIEWFDATLSANALKREEINYQCVCFYIIVIKKIFRQLPYDSVV